MQSAPVSPLPQKTINLHPVLCSPKQPLWRQLAPNEHTLQQFEEHIRKNPCNIDQDSSSLTPIRKKKQKSTTISNFLKHLQVQVQQKDSRLQTESEIVSIMDIRYNQSFHSHSRSPNYRKYSNGKSVLVDQKFQLLLIISSVKEFLSTYAAYVETSVQKYQKDFQILALNTKKLISSYQSSLSQKVLMIKTTQLQLRQQQLKHLHQNHILKSQIQSISSAIESLQQKYRILEQSSKIDQSNYDQLKYHNRELSELLLKYTKKNEVLEQKIEELKKQSEQKLSKQVKKVQEKYERLYQQQLENFELKIQNNKMLWQNYVNGNTSRLGWGKTSSLGASQVQISKIQDIVSVELCESFIGGKIEEQNSCDYGSIRLRPQQKEKPKKEEKYKIVGKAEKLRSMQNNCSPKSSSSYRRFARTTLTPQQQIGTKAQKQDTNNPFIQTILTPKFVPQKSNRLSHQIDKPQSALAKGNPGKLQSQQSQPELQKIRKKLKQTTQQTTNLEVLNSNHQSSNRNNEQKNEGKWCESTSISTYENRKMNLINSQGSNYKNPINEKLNFRHSPIIKQSRKMQKQGETCGQGEIKGLGSCYNLGNTFSTFNSVSIQESQISSCDKIMQKNEQKASIGRILKKNVVSRGQEMQNKNNLGGKSGNSKNIVQVDRRFRDTIA